MRSSHHSQALPSGKLKTLRHTSAKTHGIDLCTRYKRDGELIRAIVPAVERSEHDVSVKGDIASRDPHHGTHDSTHLEINTLIFTHRDVEVRYVGSSKPLPSPPFRQLTLPPSSPPARHLPSPPVLAQALVSLSPEPNAHASAPHSLAPTESTYSASSSTPASTSSSPLASCSPPPSSATPPSTAVNYFLEPLEVDHITRPTPEETAEVIDLAGLRHICDLPQPMSPIDSAISSLQNIRSWMSLRKYGSQVSLYWQDCLD